MEDKLQTLRSHTCSCVKDDEELHGLVCTLFAGVTYDDLLNDAVKFESFQNTLTNFLDCVANKQAREQIKQDLLVCIAIISRENK